MPPDTDKEAKAQTKAEAKAVESYQDTLAEDRERARQQELDEYQERQDRRKKAADGKLDESYEAANRTENDPKATDSTNAIPAEHPRVYVGGEGVRTLDDMPASPAAGGPERPPDV